ncbi:MAG TPA: hypothetical protein PKM57_03255, partial [Kiritimatiellia bacterium]|nr:hypothetical protein [Kiritimatiellia bacterium]HPS06033.1 hypothetical protein [Kiritimatiellia bacterium]
VKRKRHRISVSFSFDATGFSRRRSRTGESRSGASVAFCAPKPVRAKPSFSQPLACVVIRHGRCIRCDILRQACPEKAIEITDVNQDNDAAT